MKYECIPFFWSDSHLQEGFFEVSTHRHGVKCPLTNMLQSLFCSGEPVFRHSFKDLHHSKLGRRPHIQFSTLYFLHFQVRHPCEEYRTPFLRSRAGRVQLSLPLAAPGSLHCIRQYCLTFPVFVGSLLF